MSGHAYNQAYDTASERNSIFWDALSMASGSDRNSIALSIYHSVPELHQDEHDGGHQHRMNGNDKIWHDYQDDEDIQNKSVDFILAYNGSDVANKYKRQLFQKHLTREGLKLEIDESQDVHFVKIYATREVLFRYSEILKFKFPIKLDENENEDQIEHNKKMNKKSSPFLEKMYNLFRLDQRLFPKKRYELFHEFSRDKSYLFNVEEPNFFPTFVRLSVVNFILERTAFSDSAMDDNCIGIDRLLSDSIYTAAYPLHDGHHRDESCGRGLLYKEWAELRNWIKHQPLELIKNYFGVKVALYFSWLGFYTNMLILPSILGIICFIVGLSTMFSNKVVNEICNADDSVVLCPKCDDCGFTKLSETCIYSRINHILDNNFTIFFAICMAIWAAIYLELWKRYSATIVHRWGTTDFTRESEHARPAYLARLRTKKQTKNVKNIETNQTEPTLSFKFKLPNYLLSYSIIILYILLSIAVVLALIVYRMATLSSKRVYGAIDPLSFRYIVLLPVTTGIINLIVITIMNYLYDYLAVFLTDLEYRRTQTEYDNSLSLKIYLFQFINYYSSLFYIAFLKGKWPGTPAKYNRFFGLRQEECAPGGCLMELFIQLSIIMIGKQAINALLEIATPWLLKKWRIFRYGKKNTDEEGRLKATNQWTKDYKLTAFDSMGLFQEYLEMVLQFGFCTLFVISFPLAPLFALINNIFELRLDAKKFLVYYRRPVPRRQSDIGIWLTVMRMLGKISVLTTAFIIAFSTSFIPRLVHDNSKELRKMEYLNFTLAYFNTADFEETSMPNATLFGAHEICRYPEFRNPPWDEHPYKRPYYYWQILTARLAFIIIFQNVVAWLQQFIDWAIPDKPAQLDSLIKRENFLVSNKIIIEERKKALNLSRQKIGEIDYVNGRVFYEAKS
ncbi:anoctamin-2 isoform X2 [Chironomus tepperi]